MTRKQSQPLSPIHALLIAAICTGLWIAFAAHLVIGARSADFLNLYTGASMALHGEWSTIYTETAQLKRERELVPGRATLWPFVRPPAYALGVAPLALIPFRTAFWVWLTAQSVVLLAVWAWGWRRFGPEAIVWGAMMVVAPLGIAHGQDSAVYLAVVLGAYLLSEKEKPFWSGSLLGLGFVKFHLFLLWPVVLLVQKRWRMLAGLTSCALAQLLICVWALGWGGSQKYVEFVLGLDAYYSPERYINAGTILVNFDVTSRPLQWALAALIAALVLWASRKTDQLWMTFGLALGGSLLIGPHVYAYDGTMLLLPAWFAIFRSDSRILRIAAATLCTPLTLLANYFGPPFACFTACVLVVFTLTLCLESTRPKQSEMTPAGVTV